MSRQAERERAESNNDYATPRRAAGGNRGYSVLTSPNESARQVEFDRPVWSAVPDDAKDLVMLLLEKNSRLRMSAAQALEHPFIVGEPTQVSARELYPLHQCATWKTHTRNMLIQLIRFTMNPQNPCFGVRSRQRRVRSAHRQAEQSGRKATCRCS